MIQFSKPTIGDEEIEAVTKVLHSGWLAQGTQTEAFEKEFCKYIGAKYCVFTNSGTSALKMAYKWAKEQGATDMFYPQNTFCATYSAGEEMGIKMHKYTEIDNDVLDYPDVIRVNMPYGGIKDETPCLIEDSAHRIEPNDPLIGKIRCYSFYVTKNMTTGAGGMFVTNERSIYEKARLYWRDGITSSTHQRFQGKGWDYKVKTMAGGYDGNDISAAIGRIQLKKLPSFIQRRNLVKSEYNKAFRQEWQGNHLYPYFTKSYLQVKNLINFLKKNNIQAGYHYPNTGWLGVSLPLYPLLKDSEVEYIIKKVKEWRGK